jgi:hypothetical protein
MSEKNGYVVKFLTKEKFEKAKDSDNYGDISASAQAIISKAQPLDVLGLKMKEGSAYDVLEAEIIDEEKYISILKN